MKMDPNDVDTLCSAINEKLLHSKLGTNGCKVTDSKRGAFAWAQRYQKGWEERGWAVSIRPDNFLSRAFNYLAYGDDTWVIRIRPASKDSMMSKKFCLNVTLTPQGLRLEGTLTALSQLRQLLEEAQALDPSIVSQEFQTFYEGDDWIDQHPFWVQVGMLPEDCDKFDND